MMFLHSEKVLKFRSIGQNRSRYILFRVLTSSYQNVNTQGFSKIFCGFWQCGKGNRENAGKMLENV